MKTLLDYQSESGAKSGKKDVPEGLQGLINLPSTSGTPQDNPKTTPITSQIKILPNKTVNHTTQPQTIAKKGKSSINGISQTRKTDDEWRKEYWENTGEHPKHLVRRALKRDDGKMAVRLDIILNGYHKDNRHRKERRTEDDLIADGNWYHLCQLLKAMKVKK